MSPEGRNKGVSLPCKLLTNKKNNIMEKSILTNKEIYFINMNNEIEKTDLHSFIMESADETTTPKGVGKRLHVRENDEGTYDLWTWGVNGNNPRYLETFETKKEVEDEILLMTYNRFLADDQRDTRYYDTEEEAEQGRIERYMGIYSIKEDVAKSIIRKEELLKELYEKLAEKRAAEEDEKINYYAALLRFIPGENYKNTCNRLSKEIGEKIESSIFHKAIKMIRKNEVAYRLMNHDNERDEPIFHSFTLAEYNVIFKTNYKSITETIDNDPEYLFTEEEKEAYKR